MGKERKERGSRIERLRRWWRELLHGGEGFNAFADLDFNALDLVW